jgi:outer membrane receptor for ferrienterochelin and colicins
MKKYYSPVVSLIFLLLLSVINVYAQEDDSAIYELTLEELMNIEVTSASKSSESVQDAPAIITVISESEIKSYGALTLQDVLDRVVGAWTYGALAVPNSVYSLRGATTVIDNLHTLVLIDGRPTRESFRNGQYTAFYQSFPIESIKRVEVIRGPGSVLYGSGAYMGVVNIITKNGSDQQTSASLRYGTGDSYQFSGAIGKQVKDFQIALGINYLDDGGWNYSMIDENGISGNFDYRRTAMAANLKASYKDFRLSVYAGDNEQNAPGNTPVWTYDPRKGADSLGVWVVSTPRVFVNVGYDKSLSDKVDLVFDITHNYFGYHNKFEGVGYEKFQDGSGSGTLFELTSFIRPLEKLNIVLGGTVNFQSGEFTLYNFNEDGSKRNILENTTLPDPPFTAVPKFNKVWYSFYTQVDYKVSDFLKLIGGVQMNKVEELDADFVPRIGSILKFNDKLGAKLMVSNAFRAPIGLQTDVQNQGTLWGNPNLKPEKNTTYEAQIMYSSDKIESSLTYYHIDSKDLITRSLPTDSLVLVGGVSTPTFINAGTMTFDGIEFESKISLSKSFYTNIGLSYTTNEDADGNRDHEGSPNTMLKLGLSYKNPKGISIGLFNTYFGDVKSIATFDSNGDQITKDVNPETSSFNYMTVNLSLELNKLFNLKRSPSISFNIYGTNILDEDIWMAEYARRKINTTPAKGGAAIYGALKMRF